MTPRQEWIAYAVSMSVMFGIAAFVAAYVVIAFLEGLGVL